VKNGTTLQLILGDQLNTQHSWFRQVRADTLYTLMEVRLETDVVRPHIQKVAVFFSAMRYFAADLAHMGHRVIYLRLDDPKNEQSFDANLIRLIREQNITRFEYMQPDDYRLDRQLAQLA
jgi:deoxyribodipyrimidine photolyase-related protein